MKRFLPFLLLALVLPVFASAALDRQQARRFAQFDTDGNGTISRAEFVAERVRTYQKRMAQAGKAAEAITAELAKKEKNWRRLFRKKFDTDENGSLDEAEFLAYLASMTKN